MKKIVSLILCVVTVLSLFVACSSKTATTETESTTPATKYPEYAVTINTHKSGSNIDFVARALAKSIGKYTTANFIVNSCSGQEEAARETMNAEPDGYTLGVINNSVVIGDVAGRLDFDSINDMRIVSIIGTNMSHWVAIRKDTAEKGNIKTFDDLLNYTKEHPGELIVSDRVESNTNNAALNLKKIGFQVTSADVGSSTDRLTNFLGGNCDIFLGSYGLIEQYIETGDVLCLAVLADERSKFSPDIPCTAELGYPGLSAFATYYLIAPKDTPDEVVAVLEDLCQKATSDEEFISDIAANTIEPYYFNSADGTALLAKSKQDMIDLGMGGSK